MSQCTSYFVSWQHGEVKDVRLVTYRSGAPKGLAYVEFVDEVRDVYAFIFCNNSKMTERIWSLIKAKSENSIILLYK